MALDGLWIVQFTGKEILGTGVVVFSNGKLFGGETGFYYIGSYESDGKMVKARAMIRNFDPAIPSGFRILGDYEMDVSAKLQDDKLTGTAMIVGQPQHSLGIRLTKKANL
ncbi:MAG TPA: GrlR family regulatory protein [Candidatus Acidoferrum sp.]|nr:GrlR family regulatory protein [Candidatus Acidoferrum sp.]